VKPTITVSLVSHTNVGKTTLARTLLRRDVGEVLDQAHVTEVNEAYTLIETDAAHLRLWDTPGFGDSARLLRRLQKQKGPIGWFLHQVWDRVAERPLWCSQEAIKNIQNDADVVLYLVNASEDPEDAGYVRSELEILQWMQRPVLILLNQTGPPSVDASAIVQRWSAFASEWTVVREALSLDAFSRSWMDEVVLFKAVARVVEESKRASMESLADAWHARNQAIFQRCVEEIVTHLMRAAADHETLEKALSSKLEKKRAMTALADRLIAGERELWDRVIEAHGLDGSAAAEVRERIEDFEVTGYEETSPTKGAVMGGVVSGALTGLAADFLAGGLTFGGGLVAGAILGALGGAGLAHGVQLVRGDEQAALSWSRDFLERLLQQAILRYVGVAHFGRGRGEYRDVDQPEHWRAAVEDTFRTRRERFAPIWEAAAVGESPEQRLHDEVEALTRALLAADH
jgi:GTPase SAR1 family protein